MTIIVTFAMGLGVLFPLGMLKKMSGFRYVSLVSIAALFYILIVLVFELPSYVQ